MKLSLMRGLILSAISENEPINVTDLSKKVNISQGSSIYRYLKELQKMGLIVMSKELKQRGSPTILKTTPKAKAIKFDTLKKTIKFLDKIRG